jgi:hypothetical protein
MACDSLVRYSRDQLFKLYSTVGSVSADVDSCVRRLGLRAICRLHFVDRHGRVGPPLLPSSRLPGVVSVYRYRGRRAGKTRTVERHTIGTLN